MQPQAYHHGYPSAPTQSYNVTLTADQQTAFDNFVQFMLDPYDHVFVLSGYSGTGKTTLVRTLLDYIPTLEQTVNLIDPTFRGWDTELTATTNKAAEAFSQLMVNRHVKTIHSLLGLRVSTDYKTDTTKLVASNGGQKQLDKLIFIDEASYIDQTLLDFIFRLTHNCKLVFIGDPAQLAPVDCQNVPVFTSNFNGAKLTEVVRQASHNPIIDLATQFREVVNGAPWFQFIPDNAHVQWMERSQFNDAMRTEFDDLGWTYNRSKFLAWTNKCCIAHNHLIDSWIKGTHEFTKGDYAIVNKYLPGTQPIRTDTIVLITDVAWGTDQGAEGTQYTLNGTRKVFVPRSVTQYEIKMEEARRNSDTTAMEHIHCTWADLRSVYACTINKAQGSTYNKVFIDLDDVGKCSDSNQLARMLYVAVSRASEQVILTGDLV